MTLELIPNVFHIIVMLQCRDHLNFLLESIPSMFESNKTADSAFGAGMKVLIFLCLIVHLYPRKHSVSKGRRSYLYTYQ